MCLPLAAMGAISMAGQVAGAASSVVGSIFGAQAQNIQAKAQSIAYGAAADTARTNATMANMSANQTLAVGDLNSSMATKMGDINSTLITSIGDINAMVQEGSASLIRAQGDFNVATDERNAQDTLRAGQTAEQASMLGTARIKSTQRAAMAANGIALDGDSATRVLTSTDYLGAVDVDTIHANAVRSAMGYRVQGATDRATADFAALGAESEALSTRTNAAASALNVKINTTFNALNYKSTAAASAMQSKMQAGSFLTDANNNDISKAGVHKQDVATTAIGSLISEGTSVASKWFSMKKAGAV